MGSVVLRAMQDSQRLSIGPQVAPRAVTYLELLISAVKPMPRYGSRTNRLPAPAPLDAAGTSRDLTIGFAYNPASQVVTRAQSNDLYEQTVAATNRAYAVNGLNQYTQISGDGAATLSHDANGNLTSD